MSTLRRHRFILNLFLTALVSLWQIGQPLRAANINWTAGSGANFDWENASNWAGGIPTINDDVVFGSPVPNPNALLNPNTLTLSALSTARSLSLVDNYIFSGGTLTLGEGPLFVGLGYTLNMNSPLGATLLGGTNLLKTGGGAVRLANNNLYTGTTTISNGTVVISNQSALGTDTSRVLVTGSGVRGYPGGQLVLDGLAQSINFTRDLSLQGNGPIGDRSAALISVGNNELSGNVLSGVDLQSTRITSSNGMLTLSGSLDVGGTALTTVNSIGGASNAGGTAGYAITGTLTGTGILEKTGSGTLFLDPTDTSGFSGSLRISSSAGYGQSTVRITSPDVLGTRVATSTSSVIDLNAGTLEVRMDAPSVLAGGAAAHVYQRASSTIFADHSAGGSAVNGTVAFGQMAFEDNLTLTLNSRNGYGMSFGVSPVVGTTAGDNNSTITNNLTGLLTFTGNFWSNSNNTGARTYTIGGNGNTLINGNIVAASAAFNHSLVKTGSGILTITGTGSTLDGVVSVQGSLGITDFRSIGNNTESIVLGNTTTTAGNLIIGTSTAATVAGLTTSRPIVFNTTTTANAIYANQTGVNPVILNGAITRPNATTAAIILGGTNTADNVITTAIPLVGTGGVNKTGPGTWVLAGANLYTGTTNIYNGTFKLKANAQTSTILPGTNAITFVQSNQFSGGTLEFVGQASTNNVQALGALTNTNGSNTIKLTPAAGGTASMTFTSLGTFGAGSTLNVIAPAGGNNISFAAGVTAGNMQNAGIYYNGADFAYVDTGGVLRKPVYGTDADFVTSASTLTAARSNEITGSFTNAAAVTIDSLKISGSQTLNLSGLLTIRTNAASNATGGILQNDGSGKITGTGITTGGSGSLIVRVNNATDVLELNAPITATSTGGFTKSGLGTLVLSGTNAQTGTITINEGTVQLSGTGTLGAAVALTMRQASTLDLNGVTPATATTNFNSNGIVTNSSATAVTYTVGSANGTGTSFGIFKETAGVINIVKTGTGAMTWNGLSNYTGSTTISGLLTVDVLADIGVDSGIGRGNAANNAGSLVITDSASGLVYAGTLRNGELTLGSTSASTNRLFTLTGNGVTLNSTVANNLNAVVWSNTGAIVHGTNMDRTFILTGTSQGENTFNPQITDSTGFLTSVSKTGTGIWKLGNSLNTYSGPTTITQGILMATNGQGLSSNSNLVFDGGTLYSQGAFHRNIGTGAGEMRFALPAANTAQFSGGFIGGDSKLTVTWNGSQVWGSSANFLDQRNGLILNGSQARAQGATTSIALSEVDLASDFSLGAANGVGKTPTAMVTTNSSSTINGLDTSGLVVGQSISGLNITPGSYIVSINSASQVTISANTASSGAGTGAGVIEALNMRAIRVDDNGNTGADFATISGDLSGVAGTGIRKLGGGTLRLLGSNSYDGETNVNQGTLVVASLGHSTVAGNSSVGTTVNANLDSNSVTLGNGGSGGGILAYVGPGETSDRKIRINTTTGNTQIFADGSGPLILTNVTNSTSVGNKLLYLRGTNTAGNMITSQLTDNGGTLGVLMDSSATWILTGNNSYTGAVNATGGAVGIGHNNALGSGTGLVTISNSSVFAYGGDRTINNPITMSATSNTIATFIGEHSLTLNGAWSDPSTTSTGRFIRNNMAAGKTLTLNGEYIATVGTTSRSIGFDGSGDTILNGAFSTVSNVDFGVTYAGTGSLTLGGANTYSGKTTITSGTIRLGADNVIPEMGGIPGAYNGANNGVVFNPVAGVTATLEMNGKTETVGSITANTLGTAVISNTSADAASLTFGALDRNSVFIGNITNSGAGALSLTQIGTGSATFSGGTYAHKGATTVTGGSLTFAGDVSQTTSISVTGTGSLLALTGGFSGSTGLTSLTVGGGATLSLQDGVGSLVSGLTSLSLGATGTGTASLNLNVGTGATDTLTLLMGGSLSLGQTITFNLNDAGLEAGTTYTLLSIPGGGLSAYGFGNILAGSTPGGFSSITYDISDTYVRIMTGTLITGPSYFTGTTSTAWNGAANNWSSDVSGSPAALSIPGQGTDVVFVANSYTAGPLVTTLEQNFKINSLAFRPSAIPANTPASVTINPGATLTNRLEIAPQSPTDGINMASGGPAAVNIGANLKVGKDQTWTVADAGSTLTVSGMLSGNGNLTKAGSGKVILSADSDPTFDVGTVTINGGNLEMQQLGALGSASNSNVSAIIISGGAFYYNNATATTALAPVPHNITLNGGTLSAGGTNHFYGGAITLNAAATINMRDNNGDTSVTTARNITLLNTITGTGKLTVDSIVTPTGGNQLGGSLALNGDNTNWSGGINLLRGTVVASHVKALGTGAITASQGRITFSTASGTTFDLNQNITLDAPGGILELNADNTTALSDMTVNLKGVITLGSATNANNALRISQNGTDNLSIINITNSIVLGNNASISYQGSATRPLTISAIISDGASDFNLSINDELGAWAVTSRTINLTGANTFSGGLSLSEGMLQFSTVSNIGGGASNLGQGSAITLNGGTLSFIGDGSLNSQSTDRPITTVTGAPILSANGTNGASITYNGAIVVGPTADGNQLTLTGTSGSVGILAGGVTQTGDTADLLVSGGTWIHRTGTSRIGDDLVVNNAGAVLTLESGLLQVRDDFTVTVAGVLNLNGTGVLSFNTATLSADSTLRATGGGIINLGANDAVVATQFDGLRIGVDATGVGTLNMSTFNQTVTEFILGNRNIDRSGIVTGTGTLTVTGNLDLYQGSIAANLASTGSTALEKIGLGTVTLSGNNSGLASTGASILYDGTMELDYTTDNNTKLRAASQLDMRGATLTIKGSATASTVQSVGSFTLASGGNSIININPGSGQTATLNLNAITRAASAGTVRINLPATNGFVTTTSPNNTVTGLLGTGATAQSTSAAFATIRDATGTWFATNSSGNIVRLESIANNDVSAWTATDHVTDDGAGFTGVVSAKLINSLRFNTVSAAAVNVASTGVLGIYSGGILVTDQVTGGSHGILGGTLASGVSEIVLTHGGTQTFRISSDIRLDNGFTKAGDGPVLLSGKNVYTGQTQIQGGLFQISGGNAIGDTSLVTLSDDRVSTLQLLSSETIGRLAGGNTGAQQDLLATVDIGIFQLTLNQTAASTYSGNITGSGQLIKTGASTFSLGGVTAFTGDLIVNQGQVTLATRTIANMTNVGSVTLNAGSLLLEFNGGTESSPNKINNNAPLTFINTGGLDGLRANNDRADASKAESLGVATLLGGANTITASESATTPTADRFMTLTLAEMVRSNHSTLLVRGQKLGVAVAGTTGNFNASGRIVVTAAPALAGAGGANNSTSLSIVPWAIGSNSITGTGDSFVTYAATTGFRPLVSSEYESLAAATGVTLANNVRWSSAADLTLASSTARTMNSLLMENTGAGLITLNGAAASLNIQSGAFLAIGSQPLVITGFTGITTGSLNEYIFHVTNTALAGLTIEAPFTTAGAALTKSGGGTLILKGTGSTYVGPTTINQGILQIDSLDKLGNGGSGGLVLNAGTLRFGASFDASAVTITLGVPQTSTVVSTLGGILDTNSFDISFANSIGNGGNGGLTKTGLGSLSLNAAATYTGDTILGQGSLVIGADNAIGSGNLVLNGGTAFSLATHSVAVGLVTTQGAAPVITGAGTVVSNTGFFFNHTGTDPVIGLKLGGSGGVLKAQTSQVTLNAANTYTGITEIQNGGLIINSIGNVNGSANSLGIPANAQDGIIRMGLTTASTSLTYTGIGHSTDRLIAMQGSTGGVTLNANGTGAVVFGGVTGFTPGAKTLTIAGTAGAGLINATGVINEGVATLALTKSGTSTWALTTANAYSGLTTVSGGALLANNDRTLPGSATGTGNVLVNSGGRLGGFGKISGGVTLAGTGILSPGSVNASGVSTIGQLSVGTLTATSGTMLFQLGAATLVDVLAIDEYKANPGTFTVPASWTTTYTTSTEHDRLEITGTISSSSVAGTTLLVEYLDYTPEYGSVFHLMNWDGLGTTSIPGSANFGSLPSLSAGALSWNTDYFSSHGIIFVVPEPSRMLLILFGLMGLFLRRRRR